MKEKALKTFFYGLNKKEASNFIKSGLKAKIKKIIIIIKKMPRYKIQSSVEISPKPQLSFIVNIKKLEVPPNIRKRLIHERKVFISTAKSINIMQLKIATALNIEMIKINIALFSLIKSSNIWINTKGI